MPKPRNAYYAKYYLDNKDHISNKRKSYYAANRKKILARQARWREANRHIIRLSAKTEMPMSYVRANYVG